MVAARTIEAGPAIMAQVMGRASTPRWCPRPRLRPRPRRAIGDSVATPRDVVWWPLQTGDDCGDRLLDRGGALGRQLRLLALGGLPRALEHMLRLPTEALRALRVLIGAVEERRSAVEPLRDRARHGLVAARLA